MEFSSSGWVKINSDGVVGGSPGLATCGDIFRGSMGEFISGFYYFLNVHTILVAGFYGVIHAIDGSY